MAGQRVWRGRTIAVMAVVALIAGGGGARAQGADDIASLKKQVPALGAEGKHDEALVAQRALAAAVEKAETTRTGKPGWETAEQLGGLAWCAVAARNFPEALAASARALALAPDQLWIETNRAHALLLSGRLDEARALYLVHKGKRPTPDPEKLWEDMIEEDFDALAKLGISDPATASILAALGIDPKHSIGERTALRDQFRRLYEAGKYAEAVPLAEHYVALIRERFGEERTEFAGAINDLATLRHVQGRYGEAEPLLQRALAIKEKALGSDHPDVGLALNGLAELYRTQGRYGEAESLHKRSLAIREKSPGPNSLSLSTTLNNLAMLYHAQGRYGEAEPLVKRGLALREKALGPDHPDIGKILDNLAAIYADQGRHAENEAILQRALAIREKALGPDHPDVAKSIHSLGARYRQQGRSRDALPLFERALAIREKALGADHPDVADSLNSLASLYSAQGRNGEAEPLYKRALAIEETALAAGHPNIALRLNNLAAFYYSQGRLAEAEPLYKRALQIRETALPAGHPDFAVSYGNLAALYLARGEWAEAHRLFVRGADILIGRSQRGGEARSAQGVGSETARNAGNFDSLIKAAHKLAAAEPARTAALTAETFRSAQWAQASEAAGALAQMAARGARGDAGLAAIVRERQDLVAEWQKRDEARTAAVSRPPDKRIKEAEAANGDRLDAIDARIAAIDTRLKAEFPDYAALATPSPLSIQDVQRDLRSNEALILFLDSFGLKPTPEETFIWVVTKTGARWVRSELGTPSLRREVAALRCGLDASAWDGDSCAKLIDAGYTAADRDRGKPLPFETARAHKLYKALLGQVEDLIKGKHLLVVPSGPLTQLPFQVLVTSDLPRLAKSGRGNGAIDYRSVAWLARDHALTVLPAVSSLKALRRVAKPSTAVMPMIGFGNPLLDGPDARFAAQAKLAREKQRCPETFKGRVASLVGLRRGGIEPIATHGGLADASQIKYQSPLPETADELCAVARDLKADVREIRLGARATEREIKVMSASGALAKYRIVHFATHGTLAGQLRGTTEPGLILTPPENPSEDDDGYLSASEIAGLKLDADWVILSACNTASGNASDVGTTGAEALSGLARAFFFAQARAMLVSHWAVNSDATVTLITASVAQITRDKTVGRAEALRRAMLAMIDRGQPHEAHPALWAPFVVVGEGAAAR